MGFLKIPLSWKDFNLKESRKLLLKSLIPLLLQTSLSLLPAPQLDVTRTIQRSPKMQKQGTKRKKKIEQEKLEGKSMMISIFRWQMKTDSRMGLGDAPPPFHPDKKYAMCLQMNLLISLVAESFYYLVQNKKGIS